MASILRRSAVLAALLVGGWTGPALATTAGIEAEVAVSAATTPTPASGSFVADVDLSSFTFRPALLGCELTVQGALTFSGTIEGIATGTTTALVFAPCGQVRTTPPGTYADVFRFEGRFEGTVDGRATSGPLTYSGVTYEGGRIDASIVLGGAVPVVARADAQVAVGGTYTGVALT